MQVQPVRSSSPVAEVKERLHLEDVVGETFPLRGRGPVLTAVEHPSLTVYVEQQRWYWYSQATGGDVFDWYQRLQRCDFRTALEALARRAGVELRPLNAAEQQAQEAARTQEAVFGLAVTWWHEALLKSPTGLAYCEGRGWTAETIRHFQLGLSARAGDEHPPLGRVLQDAGLGDHPAARAVLSAPVDYLVYPHLQAGRCVYFSARSISGKRHWNPPAELVGERRPFAAWPADGRNNGIHLVVEGQADAISLAQMGYRATALCGTKGQVAGATHVAMDTDAAGRAATLDVALAHGPLTGIVEWPGDVGGKKIKDANDLLCAGAPEVVALRVEQAAPALQMLAWMAGRLKGDERKARLEQLFSAYDGLDELTAADLKTVLAQSLGGIGNFNRLYRAYKKNRANEDATAAEDRDSPERYENSAGGAVGGVVFEQCVSWDEAGTPTCAYAVRQADGSVKMQAVMDVGGTTFVPYPGSIDLIRKRVVLFPSAAAEFGSQRSLLAEVRAFIHRWLDVDTFYEQLASYYVMFTWLYDLFETLPYLRALGDYGTGKSRFLQTVGVLCYRPMFVSGASTASPIFRVIDMFRGTLVVDEADFASSEAEAEIIKIINVGYARGGVVLRAEKDQNSDTYYPSAKDVFCPKVLATRRLFADRATESRCLTKRMSTARPRPDIPRLLGRQFWADAEALRNKLLMYRLRSYRAMDVDPALSDFSIEPRLDQVTLALKSIIKDEAMREQINTFVRAYNSTLISDRQMSVPAVVVQVLAETWYRPQKMLTGDERDWSIKGLAERVKTALEAVDPEEKMNPRRLSALLSEDLGMTRRGQDPVSRRATLVIEEPALHALMNRYGVDMPA